MTYFLDLRADNVGGVLATDVTSRRDWDAIDPSILDQESEGRDVLFVAHGFNVDRKSGIDHLSWWKNRLQLGPSILFVGILWPGDSAWVPVIDYPLEGNEAIGSGQLLSRFLNQHLLKATSLAFASHSLGARVMLEAIRGLRPPVRSLTLMAGAIDNTCLIDEYRDTAAKVKSISILASRSDDVLRIAFPAGNFFSGILARGNPYWHTALGREGPDPPYPNNLRRGWQIPDSWGYGHGDYLGNAAPIGPLIAPPIDIPPQGSPAPILPADWQPAWSAAFTATRL